MEYKIIGGGHIAYFDNTARTVRQKPSAEAARQTASGSGGSTAGAGNSAASPFAAALDKAKQGRGTPQQGSPTSAATVQRTEAATGNRAGQTALGGPAATAWQEAMLSAGSANGQKQTTTARAALATSSGQGQAAMGRVATVTGRAGRQASAAAAPQASAPTSTPTLPSSSPQAQASLLPAAAAAATRTVSAERSHTVKAGDTVWELAVKVYKVDPEEILRLNNISDPRALQIGAVLRIPGKIESRASEAVVASWYGAEHHGRPMANGDPYDMYAPTIAHKDLPLGTRVLLGNPATGETATATVTDRGPYIAGRDVDLSYHLAQRLSLERQGVGDLTMRIL